MRKNLSITLLLSAAALLVASSASAQVFAQDDISYPDGSLVGNGSWQSTGGTPGDMLVENEQVKIEHGIPSEDTNLPFAPQAGGNMYYGLDFSVDDLGAPYAGTDNEYFAHFKVQGAFDFSARLDVVEPTGGGDYSVGISSDQGLAEAIWPTDLTYGTVYRAIVRYDQDNNIAELWIDPTSDSDPSILGADAADPGDNVGEIALRQSDSSENETVRVDNILVGRTFNDAGPVVPVPGASSTGLIVLTLIMLGGGTAFMLRRRADGTLGV